jgi:hypothetical protein
MYSACIVNWFWEWKKIKIEDDDQARTSCCDTHCVFHLGLLHDHGILSCFPPTMQYAPLPWAPENTSRKGWSPLAPSTWSFHSPPLQDERRGANAGSVVSARLVSTQFRYGFWGCVAHCLFVLLLLSVRGLGALVISSLSFNTVLLQGACQIAVMAWVL